MQKEATTGSTRETFLQQEVAHQQQLIKTEDDLAESISLLSDLSCEIARSITNRQEEELEDAGEMLKISIML
jgi:hypothetical protein